jgi:hypothetical protein
LSSCISWYLKANTPSDEREELFEKAKDIYNIRSRIVHGDNYKNPIHGIGKFLIIAEELNTTVFNQILAQDHIKLFSMSEKRRRKQLQKLSIGVPCEFLSFVQ